jgi:hypothetical protein
MANCLRRLAPGFFLFLLGVGVGGGAVWYWIARPPATSDEPPVRWEATVFLPIVANPEHPFTIQDWDDAIALLVKAFGGATLGTEIEGWWMDDQGRLQRERVRPVIVSFEPAKLGDFRRVLDTVGRRLGQKAMYTRFERPQIEVQTVP